MRTRIDGPLEKRFWCRVNKEGPIHSSLGRYWIWTGSKDRLGYGYLGGYTPERRAYRLSYVLNVGPIQEELCVLHRCDNPSCVNPAHLFLGTRYDNNKDRHRKGRSGDHRGESNGRALLTETLVAEIRLKYRAGVPATKLMSEYGLKRSALYNLLSGHSWSHVE